MSRLYRSICIPLSLSLGLICAVPSQAGETWGSFRGPEGTGASSESLPMGDGPLSLQLAWKRPLGSGYSGVSIADGKLVTAFTDGEHDFLVALDPASGDEQWRYELGPVYKGHDGSHTGPIATPAIADGRVFMLDPAGHVAALDLADGATLWTTHVTDDLGSEKPYYGFAGSPVVFGDTVIFQIGGEAGAVAGFDVASGDLRWRSFEDGIDAQSPILAEIGGREQVLVMGATKLAGLDPTDGTVLWEFEHEGDGPMGAQTQSPIPLDGSRFFVKHEDPSSAVIELTEVDGVLGAFRVHQSRGMARSYSPAAVSGDHVYGFTARFLSAVDPASGDLMWRSRDVGDGFLISVDGQLAILQKTGSLHLGAASPDGWSETDRLELFEDLAWTPPSYADGSIYVRSLGEIARVDLVRTQPGLMAESGGAQIPASLAALAASVASSQEPAAEIDRFLDGRALPIIDGDSVVFLYRGEADDVAIAGDMIGMRREEPMNKLEGTHLWWWEIDLDPRARISYLFYPDLEPTLDPGHDRVVAATILGPDMNWNRGEPFQMSWFAMPEWPGLDVQPSEPATRGRLETVELTVQPSTPEGEEPPEPVAVPTTVWLPPGYDDTDDRYAVAYVLNTEALEEGNWPATLDRVVGHSVEPLIVAFPEFPRVPGLRGSLAGQVVPQMDETFRTRADRDSRAIIGMGFPGFNAAMTGFASSDTFGAMGIQSLFFLEGGMKDGLRGVVGDKTPETTPMRIYFEWGRWDLISPHEEMNFRASSKWAWDFLREKGYEPIGGEVWDSTDFASWAHRTGLMLESLFPTESAETRLDVWLTGR